jgi:hypothetical protein
LVGRSEVYRLEIELFAHAGVLRVGQLSTLQPRRARGAPSLGADSLEGGASTVFSSLFKSIARDESRKSELHFGWVKLESTRKHRLETARLLLKRSQTQIEPVTFCSRNSWLILAKLCLPISPRCPLEVLQAIDELVNLLRRVRHRQVSDIQQELMPAPQAQHLTSRSNL